ncbi:phage tail tape measure protein [Arthrobacter sp. 2RAF6]|uniref:phage tail tape measure protein n=1 Tax=Arthrobacter sp. 2RAF6 TaxID=3233002 RepID=UPI003F93B0BC
METVGKGAAIMGGAILAGIGVAVAAYSEFAGRMAQVQSLSHASAGEMDVLTKSALTMGTAFGLSANDVADAEIELVKAGVSVKDMIGGALPGALALAAAGQIDVGKATEIATIALTQFNLSGKDVPHVADLLAAGADKALGGVEDLGYGLKQGGLIAAQFGLTIDDTVGTLSAFANAGLLGADAGTSMKTMFLSLASPSKQAQKVLDEYKISAYDSRGAFVGVTDLAGQLHDKLGNLSDAQRNAALSTIFGTDAMRAASVLMKEGSTGIQQWIKDVNDQGFAAAQAAGKMNSLQGDFKKLQAAVETGMIQMGSAADGALRPAVKAITDVITGFNKMDPAAQGAIMTFAAVSGGVLLAVGGLLTFIPKIHESIEAYKAFRTAIATASPGMQSALTGLGKAAGVAAAAFAILATAAALGNAMAPAIKGVEETTQALLKMQNASTASVDGLFKGLRAGGHVDDINGIGDALNRINNMNFDQTVNKWFNDVAKIPDALKTTRDQLDQVDGSLANFANSGSFEVASTNFHKIAVEADKHGVSLATTAKSFPQYMDSLRKYASEMKVSLTDQELLDLAVGRIPQTMKDAQASTEGTAKATELAAKASAEQAKALSDVGISAQGTVVDLDKLVTSMVNSGLIQLSANDALRNYYASLDAVDASIKQNGKSLDIHTEKGRANQKALDDVASSSLALVKANAKNGDSQEELSKNLNTSYNDLLANYAAFGITGDAADTMARKALGIPKDVNIDTAIQNYADSMAKLNGIRQGVDAIRDYKEVAIHVQYTESGTAVRDRASDAGTAGASVQAFATGGAVTGAGSKGVDSIRSVLAPGEHVLSDSDVDAMGGQAAVYAFRKQLHNGGGGVRPMYAAAAPAAPVMTQLSNGGDMQMTGTLVLDSGEVMGTFRGIARQAAAGAISAANSDANRRAAR